MLRHSSAAIKATIEAMDKTSICWKEPVISIIRMIPVIGARTEAEKKAATGKTTARRGNTTEKKVKPANEPKKPKNESRKKMLNDDPEI